MKKSALQNQTNATSSGDAKRPVDEKSKNRLQTAKINVFDPIGLFGVIAGEIIWHPTICMEKNV